MASAAPTQDLLQMQNLVFGRWPLPDPFVPGVARVEAVAHAIHTTAASPSPRCSRSTPAPPSSTSSSTATACSRE